MKNKRLTIKRGIRREIRLYHNLQIDNSWFIKEGTKRHFQSYIITCFFIRSRRVFGLDIE